MAQAYKDLQTYHAGAAPSALSRSSFGSSERYNRELGRAPNSALQRQGETEITVTSADPKRGPQKLEVPKHARGMTGEELRHATIRHAEQTGKLVTDYRPVLQTTADGKPKDVSGMHVKGPAATVTGDNRNATFEVGVLKVQSANLADSRTSAPVVGGNSNIVGLKGPQQENIQGHGLTVSVATLANMAGPSHLTNSKVAGPEVNNLPAPTGSTRPGEEAQRRWLATQFPMPKAA